MSSAFSIIANDVSLASISKYYSFYSKFGRADFGAFQISDYY